MANVYLSCVCVCVYKYFLINTRVLELVYGSTRLEEAGAMNKFFVPLTRVLHSIVLVLLGPARERGKETKMRTRKQHRTLPVFCPSVAADIIGLVLASTK